MLEGSRNEDNNAQVNSQEQHNNDSQNGNNGFSFQSQALMPLRSILKLGDKEPVDYRRNITWNDLHGRELTTLVEFETSEQEESDVGEYNEPKSCCSVM